MATWNTDKPALTNTIAADIPDIEECLQELHDVIEAITNGTLGTTTAANFKVDVLADGADCGTAPTMTSPVITTGVNDGTNAISFPTNGMAAAKFMLGNSNTIAWFYLNTAPPGWKVLTTGADTVLAISGGSDAYNVNGGNPDSVGDWTTNWNHTLTVDEIPAHTHTLQLYGDAHTGTSAMRGSPNPANAETTSSTGGGGSHNHGRPSASVGKLFQLDTA